MLIIESGDKISKVTIQKNADLSALVFMMLGPSFRLLSNGCMALFPSVVGSEVITFSS